MWRLQIPFVHVADAESFHAITEPISFAMDRRMVLRVKELAEHAVPA